MTATARYSYVVRYRRHGWKDRQFRYFRDRRAADRLIDKLMTPDSWLAPIVECRLERQRLGPVETVWTYE